MTALIALIVLAKNSQSATNRLFIGLAIGLVGWSITTYFSLHTMSDEQTLFWIRLVMLFVIIQNTSFFLLVRVFPSHSFAALRNKKLIALIAYSALTAAVAVSPYLFVGFEDGAPVPGPGMALFLPHAIITAAGGLLALVIRYRRARGSEKAQLQYFLAGTILMFTMVPVGNFVIPVVLKLSQFVVLSPLYSIIFSGLFAYAIVAKRMFDVRFTIARAISYLLLFFSLVTLYVAGVFGAVALLFGGNQVSSAQTAVYAVAALFLAFTFVPLRAFFRRLTNNIFFRDAYDTKLVLDKITSVLVRAVAVDQITKQSLTILKDALKSESISLYIGEHNIHRSISVGRNDSSFKPLLEELGRHSHPLLVADEMADQGSYMTQLMAKANTSVVARLETSKELIGYAFFGYKESGNIYSGQDVELIRISADELAVAIQNALRFEEITRFNETLQAQVDEATKQLRESNKKLQALDEAKDEFMSMASHQLRTPLTSVKGYVSMVLDGDAGRLNNDQKKLLGEAYASAQRMVYMIADFLNVSRLKTGKFLIEPSTVDLPKMLNEELSQLEPTARARGLTLEAHIPAEFPELQLDETKIRQVLMNFIDNAIFYSNSGGTITVSLDASDGIVTFTVKDTGIGVPVAERSKVFSKFFRATNARHVRPDGTGIGLFMAKKVVSAHGGDMIFESQENKGSLFGFTLPYGGNSKKLAETPRPTASQQ